MAIKAEHELHSRRFSRNLGVGLTLPGFVVLVFALSVVKIKTFGPVEGYDYQPRPSLVIESEGQ